MALARAFKAITAPFRRNSASAPDPFVSSQFQGAAANGDIVDADGNVVGGGSVAVIHGQIGASELAKAIVVKIEALQQRATAMLGLGNIVEFIANYDAQKVQQQLEDFMQSSEFKHLLAFAEQNAKLLRFEKMLSDAEKPDNAVYLCTERDDHGRIVKLDVGFNSRCESQYLNLDLADIQRQVDLMQGQDYSCLNDVSAFTAEIEALSDNLKDAKNNAERAALIKAFNTKYKGQVTLTYTIKESGRSAKYNISDGRGVVNFNGDHTLKYPIKSNAQKPDFLDVLVDVAATKPAIQAAAAKPERKKTRRRGGHAKLSRRPQLRKRNDDSGKTTPESTPTQYSPR